MSFGTFVRDHLSILLVLAIVIITLIVGWKYIAVVILAASLAVVIMPLHRMFKKKLPEVLSATIVTTLLFVFLAVIAAVVFAELYKNLDFFIDMIESIINFIFRIFNLPPTGGISDILNTLSNLVTGSLSTLVLSAIANVAVIFIGFILLYACLYLFIIFGDRIIADFRSIIPENSKESIHSMAVKTKGILFSVYVVQVAMALLVFVLALIYAALLGYGHIVFIAMLCAVGALIPMVGAMFALILMALYSISLGDWRGLIITATVGYFLLCILIDFILRPKLTATKVKVRPMLMFVGFFGGAAVMGFIGFILGPVLLVLGITAYDVFFKEMRKMKKEELAEIAAASSNTETAGDKN